MEGLFGGNLFFIYLFFVIAIMNYSKFSMEQKIVLIYICSFGLTFNQSISKWLVLIVLCMMLFLCQEYLTSDTKKIQFLYKVSYKVIDCIYMSVFQYRLLGIFAAIFVRSVWFSNILCSMFWFVNEKYIIYMTDIIAIVILFYFSIHGIFRVKEKHCTFTEMFGKIWNKYPYYLVNFDSRLSRRLNLIVDMEDHSYFQREHSYSFISKEYIKIWRSEHKAKEQAGVKDGINKEKKRYVAGLYSLLKKALFRGHSTIGMQLIRILSYKEGLIFGKPKNIRDAYRVTKRKLFECIYARLFFEGMEKYIKEQLCNDIKNYRKYIVYLYPNIVQTTINGKTYIPMASYFDGKKMNEWDIHELFIACLGLNSLAITQDRIDDRRNIADKYGVYSD